MRPNGHLRIPTLFMYTGLVDPPNVLFNDNAKDVNDPNKTGTGEDGKSSQHNAKNVLFVNASAKTCDVPNDVQNGNAEDQFNNKGKIAHCFDKAFHRNSPII